MPLYSFECPACHTAFDHICKYEERAAVICTACKKPVLPVVTTPNFKLKGDGFYSPTKTGWD